MTETREPVAAAHGGRPGHERRPERPSFDVHGSGDDMALVYESGVELQARSQWGYAARRFLRHRLAMAGLIGMIFIILVAVFADKIAPYPYDLQDFNVLRIPPTTEGQHYLGTDLLGRDFFSRVLFGLRTSLWVAFLITGLATLIGTADRRGRRLLRRLGRQPADADHRPVLTLPGLAILLAAAIYLDPGKPFRVALILAALLWTGVARIVRGTFLSLREKEFVEAAKASGAGDARIIVRHMLPNAVGPIIVTATLIVAGRDPDGGGALVPRLRDPAAQPGAWAADQRRPERGPEVLVDGHRSRHDHRLHRTLRSTSSATACATRSTRPRGACVTEPLLSIRDLDRRVRHRGRRRQGGLRRQLRRLPRRDRSGSSASRARARASAS